MKQVDQELQQITDNKIHLLEINIQVLETQAMSPITHLLITMSRLLLKDNIINMVIKMKERLKQING
jgi:hypothetical protein